MNGVHICRRKQRYSSLKITIRLATAFGERLASLISVEQLKQAMALVALSPHIPLLFMGEESATTTPFLFFCDWEGELARGTRDGRRKEFSAFRAFSTPETRGRIPDPCARQTFLASCLDWQKLDREPQSLEFQAFTKTCFASVATRSCP